MTGNLQYRFSATADLAVKRYVDGELSNRYLHGPLVDQLLVDERVDASESLSRWVLTDHQGTVRDLAVRDAITDEIIISNHRVFDAFGNLLSETAGGESTIFGYAGREWEEVADLQFNRAHWYDRTIGRWISQDPIGFAAGDANLYQDEVDYWRTVEEENSRDRDPWGWGS